MESDSLNIEEEFYVEKICDECGYDCEDYSVSSEKNIGRPIDLSPPWWDGTIAIPFSAEEWEGILTELRMLHQIPSFPENDYDQMLINVMDRIEKNIGIE